jgi:hypothetical protein
MDLTTRIILRCVEPQQWHWTEYHSIQVYEHQLDSYDLRQRRDWLRQLDISLHRDCVRMRTNGLSQVALTWWAEMDHATWTAYAMTWL